MFQKYDFSVSIRNNFISQNEKWALFKVKQLCITNTLLAVFTRVLIAVIERSAFVPLQKRSAIAVAYSPAAANGKIGNHVSRLRCP